MKSVLGINQPTKLSSTNNNSSFSANNSYISSQQKSGPIK